MLLQGGTLSKLLVKCTYVRIRVCLCVVHLDILHTSQEVVLINIPKMHQSQSNSVMSEARFPLTIHQ